MPELVVGHSGEPSRSPTDHATRHWDSIFELRDSYGDCSGPSSVACAFNNGIVHTVGGTFYSDDASTNGGVTVNGNFILVTIIQMRQDRTTFLHVFSATKISKRVGQSGLGGPRSSAKMGFAVKPAVSGNRTDGQFPVCKLICPRRFLV